MPRQIDLVVFDCGNVLAVFDTRKWLDFLMAHQRPEGRNPESFFRADFVVRWELDEITVFEFFEATKEYFGLEVSKDKFFFALTDCVKPDPRMSALKQTLKQNGVRVAVSSNISRYHFEYMNQKWPDMFIGFDYLALSFRMKTRKPDHRMFDAPAKYLGIPSTRCLLIDDLKVNTDAFEKWGGIGHYYNVVDDKFCQTGWLEIERNRLMFKLATLGLLTYRQASDLTGVNF